MKIGFACRIFGAFAVLACGQALADPAPPNLILFVPDGLRSRIVTAESAPTFERIRREGVDFANSHSLYPTVTTANASAFATAHGLADTGDFSNSIYTGVRVMASNGTVTPFLESDPVLRQVNEAFEGDYLNESAIIAAARAHGYAAALIGKLGPVALFDPGAMQGGGALVVDDATGVVGQEVPLSADWQAAFAKAKVPLVAPGRGSNGDAGNSRTPGAWVPDLAQQQYFLEAAIKVVLPRYKESGQRFVMVFWSRDPDGTQHNNGDSFQRLDPGINGVTSLAAVRNADTALALIEDALKKLGLFANTDIVVAADHGFSTILKSGTQSPSVNAPYKDVRPGDLPPGFLAIDLSVDLQKAHPGWRLFDPDAAYRALDWHAGEHPSRGNGLIGEDPDHPQVVVVANGGSDLVYLPPPAPHWPGAADSPATASAAEQDKQALARQIVAALSAHDYVSGLFVDAQRFGEIPGALSTADIGIGDGTAVTPHPAIVVNFASRLIPGCALREESLCTAEIADTGLQEGQGMHGSFSRSDTFNFMAARGPDFRAGYVDSLPASNADIGATIAHVLGLELHPRGKLQGRILTEALAGGATHSPPAASVRVLTSTPGAGGLRTILQAQSVGEHTYYTRAGFPGRTAGLTAAQ